MYAFFGPMMAHSAAVSDWPNVAKNTQNHSTTDSTSNTQSTKGMCYILM